MRGIFLLISGSLVRAQQAEPNTKLRRLAGTICLGIFLSLGYIPAHADLQNAGDAVSSYALHAAYVHTLAHRDADGILQLAIANHAGRWTKAWLKDEVGKTRPDGSDDRSFPSGHTMSASIPAWYITERYGWREGWPYHIAAAVAGAARVEARRHYSEDVIGTHLLAWGIAKLFTGPDGGPPPIGITFNNGVRAHFFKRF